eukprot:scaffold15532_cov67-Phaeocystis_antarctica.AAC.2
MRVQVPHFPVDFLCADETGLFLGLFRSSLCETKGRTCKRGTVQLARTRDTPRAKQSYTENFHRPSHRARRHFPEVIADVAHSIVPRVLSSSVRPALSAKPHLNMVPACGCPPRDRLLVACLAPPQTAFCILPTVSRHVLSQQDARPLDRIAHDSHHRATRSWRRCTSRT